MKITLKNITSYSEAAELDLKDKKIGLAFGLNGTGKSTLSDFLYDRNKGNPSDDYSSCTVEKPSEEEILVYNQQFVQDNFYKAEAMPGVFTLGEENSTAKREIAELQVKIEEKKEKKNKFINEQESFKAELENIEEIASGKTWEIKQTYTGGDRVLDFCLDTHRGNKNKLFKHIKDIQKPDPEPNYSIDNLKQEAQETLGEDAQEQALIQTFKNLEEITAIEENPIFSEIIVGSENSILTALINKFENADWVKQGLNHLPGSHSDGDKCPFCQQGIDADRHNELKAYFDEAYTTKIEEIESLQAKYKAFFTEISEIFSSVQEHPSWNTFSTAEMTATLNKSQKNIKDNLTKITEKKDSPSQIEDMKPTSGLSLMSNQFIQEFNSYIEEKNQKIQDKEETKKNIVAKFWRLMRWEYDQTITAYNHDTKEKNKKLDECKSQLNSINNNLLKVQKEIINKQKETVNIEEAIENINKNLTNIGLMGFSVKKSENELYKIKREDEESNQFKTLSEGEKMIISFLYFIEVCKGTSAPDKTPGKRIVVIDDPISSLSQAAIFEVSHLIKSILFKSDKFSKILILTHSLYFFTELKKNIHANQFAYYSFTKAEGNKSRICDIKENQILSYYQHYWEIIKSFEKSPNSNNKVVMANTMRNIVEYFFSFVEQEEWRQSPDADHRHFSFYRFMNRESHSDYENIADNSEIDPEKFMKTFESIFVDNGYEDHYKKMMGKGS